LEQSLTSLKINEQLTEVPVQSLKPLLSLATLNLASNQISAIPSYSFSSLFGLTTLVLDGNPIPDSGLLNNSFWDAIQLSSVSLGGCQLKTLPIKPFLAISSTLQTLTISTNLITTVPAYAFQQLTALQTVDLSFNPITSVAPYAFYGLQTDSLIVESFDSMTTISFDIFDGMPNVGIAGFHHFDNLINITLDDPSKLPASLSTMQITMNPNLQRVDQSIEEWLKLSPDNVMNLKGTNSFDCNPSISWMYPWVFCVPSSQIFDVAYSVYCSNGVEFSTYLASLQQGC